MSEEQLTSETMLPPSDLPNADDSAAVESSLTLQEKQPDEDNTQTAQDEPSSTNDERHWDHTSKKVVVHNVLKFIRSNEIHKLTSSWTKDTDIVIVKTKKPPKENWIKVTLKEDEMVDKFIKLINEGGEGGKAMCNARGGVMFAKRANEMDDRDTNDRKRKERDDDNGDARDIKRSHVVKILSADEVRDAITPLWRKEYKDQLDVKAKEMVNKCSKNIVKEIKRKFRTLEHEAKRGHREAIKTYTWVEAKRAISVEQPVPSPQIYEYRNKCEFTCGYRHVEVKSEESVDKDTKDEGDGETKGTTEDLKPEEVNADPESSNNETPNTIKKIPAAGFLAQGWQGGVYSPHCLQNVPDWACAIADILNEYLPTSPMAPYDSKVHRGFFRSFTIRCSLRTRECMVIVLHAPAKGGVGAKEDGSDDYSEVFEAEKERLVGMLTKAVLAVPNRDFPEGHVRAARDDGSEEIRVTSVFFQEYEGLSQPGPDHPVQHVYGKTCLEERLGQCTFQISPGAFFQTNTEGAEKLYGIIVDRIKEVTQDPKQTLLFDVCCGTGTIGLTCLKEGIVGRLVGVDIAEPAILDAKVNAEKNGFLHDDNNSADDKDSFLTRFIASPAEKVLAEEMKSIPRTTPVVAVVDPARDGLHGAVVQTLRKNEKIERLVYVSCNPTGTLVRDAAMLCAPPTKKYPGRPFKPVLAQPVDMFPLTSHCEMVMTFDRMSEEEYGKYQGNK
eukprot:CCRYP_013033-RB/>CCRYP_013033-RB protein AED:0.24 eAED:0.24 QI:114/1/1/1/1/1/4/201/724